MNVEIRELSKPVKVIVMVDMEDVQKRKVKIYETVKNDLPAVDGFRKGHIPREIAEKRFELGKLYKGLFDDIYTEISSANNIIASKDFKIFGDLADTAPLRIEFIAELEPTVELPEFEVLNVEYDKNPDVAEKEIDEILEKALESNKTFEEVEKDGLENLDVALIDFEGTLLGEKSPFKGGSAKDYRLVINKDQKTFIDNFEEQMIGMKKGEERNLSVKFPDDYRDKSKAGKSAVFHVLLKSIQKSVVSELNDDFAKKVGYQDMDEYKKKMKERLLNEKIRKSKDDLKKTIIKEFLDKSKFSPVPVEMVEHETEREWFSFLRRMGEEEKDYLKKNPDAKEFFISSHLDSSEALIKTTMILKAAIKKYGIEVSKEEVTTYTLNISTALQYDEEKKSKIMKDLDDPQIYKIQERAALNEKVISFLVSKFE